MTVGPWKPITLHSYNIRITDVNVRSKVSESLDVQVTIDFSLSLATSGYASIVLKCLDSDKRLAEKFVKINEVHGKAEFYFAPGVVDLWYPVGYGKQPMYTVEVQIENTVASASVYTFAHVIDSVTCTGGNDS
jgi:beta-mannosidase